MYVTGDLRIVEPRCEQAITEDDDYCDYAHVHAVMDSSFVAARDGAPVRCGPGTIYLPHAYGNWVIGSADEVRMLIKDLQQVLRSTEELT